MNVAVRKAGFTVVELMAVAVSAAVLAITAGALLYFGYTGWRRTSGAVEIQRDASAAMDVIWRAVRSGSNITVSAGRLDIQTPSGAVTLRSSGGNLIYDPAGETLVQGRLVTFRPVATNRGASVTLVLRDGKDQFSNTVFVVCRN